MLGVHTYHTVLRLAISLFNVVRLISTRVIRFADVRAGRVRSMSFNLAYQHVSPPPFHPYPLKHQTHLCLCFGFLLQIIYTYLPFFLLTLLHPSHSFFTELRTFMPLACALFCNSKPLKRAVRSSSGCARDGRRLGRNKVLHAQVGV
jgi:hypothetical protein